MTLITTASGANSLMSAQMRGNQLPVVAIEVLAALTRSAHSSRGNYDDVAAANCPDIIGAANLGIVVTDRARFRYVQGFSGGKALLDIHQQDRRRAVFRDEEGAICAHIAASDDTDLFHSGTREWIQTLVGCAIRRGSASIFSRSARSDFPSGP